MHNRLKRARTSARMTQGEVAAEMGVTRQTVSSWERGTTSPSIEQLAVLCAVYGVSADLILYGEVIRFDAAALHRIAGRQESRAEAAG